MGGFLYLNKGGLMKLTKKQLYIILYLLDFNKNDCQFFINQIKDNYNINITKFDFEKLRSEIYKNLFNNIKEK